MKNRVSRDEDSFTRLHFAFVKTFWRPENRHNIREGSLAGLLSTYLCLLSTQGLRSSPRIPGIVNFKRFDWAKGVNVTKDSFI